ncbi:sigma-70 family RNA polymerase sigma factor [Roseateles sp. GG27B]
MSPNPNPVSSRNAELAALLSRIALRDRSAFEALYRSSSAQLFGVVLRINSDRAQAADVLQEVFVNVWRAADGFDDRLSQPMTWLTSVARNRAIDSLRRSKSAPVTVSRYTSSGDGDDDAEHDLLENMPDQAAGPLDLLEQASRNHSLETCMQALNGQQRSSLALAYYQGLSHAEVAEQLCQPLGTVKSWVRRWQSLRSCLDRAAGLSGAGVGAL